MIVTRSWLEEFINLENISTEEICNTLNNIGQEVEAVKEIRIPKKVVVGYVEECEKHPDADKLNVCKVNIGEEIVQIVCGAKNVAKGQFVPVSVVGAVLGENFKIKKAKLRGIDSFGMICSSTEIGLPKLNDGIMVLDDSIGELVIGKELSEYPIINDDIIELGVTANRGDSFSVYGIARELSAGLNISLKNLPKFEDEYSNEEGIGRALDIEHSELQSSHLIKALNSNHIKSTLKIDYRLALLEESAKTDLDKITKYATIATGVLVNSFRFRKNENQAIKLSINSENGVDSIKFENKVIYQVGIKVNYENLEENKLVVVDSNFISPNIVSEMVHSKNLETDETFFRASRGSGTDLEFGMNYFLVTLSENNEFALYISEFKINDEFEEKRVNFDLEDIYSIIGEELDKNLVVNILNKLSFKATISSDSNSSVIIPPFRHDIENQNDIAEEILRIYGIDKLKSHPLTFEEKNRINLTIEKQKFLKELRVKSVTEGFYEVVHFLFEDKERLKKYGFDVIKEDKDLLNPITNELNSLRTTLTLQLLDDVANNQKNGYKKIKLFQIGSVYNSERDENQKIAFVHSGNIENENISNKAKVEKVNFELFVTSISKVIGKFELKTNEESKIEHPYQNAKIVKNGKEIGIIAKVHPTILKDFDIENDTFICEIELNEILPISKTAKPINRLQKSQRDLSLVVAKEIEYLIIKNAIDELLIKDILEFYPIDIFDLGEENSLTIRFIIQNSEKTLTDDEINDIISKIVEKLNSLGINLR